MRHHLIAFAAAALLLVPGVTGAEVLVRWTEPRVVPPQAFGLSTLVVPAGSRDAVREAVAAGYRVYVEVPAPQLATFAKPAGTAGVVVRGTASSARLAALRARLGSATRILTPDERGKWPHIRSNWVTKNGEVLQVAGRSAQPWIETNAALIRIASAASGSRPPVLTYEWTAMTLSDVDEGPAPENYLVAIAEAGSFGADLVLPLHERFQRRLLLGDPDARRHWDDIRRYIDFYAGDLPSRYQPSAGIGVVTSTPMVWFEVMNLLARHNLPFELIPPAALAERRTGALKLLIVLDPPDAAQVNSLAEFERSGGVVVIVAPAGADGAARYPQLAARIVEAVADPNKFALDMRRLLGRPDRILEIWNGITVVAAPFRAPDGPETLVTLVNYAHQATPVQLRVRGTFSRVQYEAPEEPAALLPHELRDGHTEFLIPSLRAGGRIFLTR